MSVFSSSSIVSGAALDVASLISKMDSLAVGVGISSASGALSTVSGSDVSLISRSETFALDDIVLALFKCQFSTTNTNTFADFVPYSNGVAYSAETLTGSNFATGALGNENSITSWWFAQDLSGSITMEMRFKRFAGSGTVHIGPRSLAMFRFKRKT